MKLTKANVAKITVPPGKSEIIVFDDDIPGWALRVRAGGSATWIFQYRQCRKQRRISLGSASAISAQNARTRASHLHARVKLGEDPAGQKIENRTKAAETFGTAVKKFLAKRSELKPSHLPRNPTPPLGGCQAAAWIAGCGHRQAYRRSLAQRS